MRDNDLLKNTQGTNFHSETEDRISVEQCVDKILLAVDKRARKVA